MIVEGGVTLHRSFWDAGLVDRVQVYMTPHVLGPGWTRMAAVSLARAGPVATRQLGTDLLAEAYVHRSD